MNIEITAIISWLLTVFLLKTLFHYSPHCLFVHWISTFYFNKNKNKNKLILNDHQIGLFRLSVWKLNLVVWILNSQCEQTADSAEIWSPSWEGQASSGRVNSTTEILIFGCSVQADPEWAGKVIRSYYFAQLYQKWNSNSFLKKKSGRFLKESDYMSNHRLIT